MLKLAIALFVLLSTCAIAKTADAQTRNCNVPLGHMMPAGCTQADAAARRQAIINGYRARAEEAQIHESYQQERDQQRRRYYGSAADDICFGCNPDSRFGTLYGRPMGREGQCDRNGCYGSSYSYGGDAYYRYGNDGWYYNQRGVYLYPYAEPGVDMNVPPQPPKDVYVGGGRGWKCKHLERAWMCRVGSTTGEKVLMALAGGVLIYALAK